MPHEAGRRPGHPESSPLAAGTLGGAGSSPVLSRPPSWLCSGVDRWAQPAQKPEVTPHRVCLQTPRREAAFSARLTHLKGGQSLPLLFGSSAGLGLLLCSGEPLPHPTLQTLLEFSSSHSFSCFVWEKTSAIESTNIGSAACCVSCFVLLAHAGLLLPPSCPACLPFPAANPCACPTRVPKSSTLQSGGFPSFSGSDGPVLFCVTKRSKWDYSVGGPVRAPDAQGQVCTCAQTAGRPRQRKQDVPLQPCCRRLSPRSRSPHRRGQTVLQLPSRPICVGPACSG